jgi:hypothetical protein
MVAFVKSIWETELNPQRRRALVIEWLETFAPQKKVTMSNGTHRSEYNILNPQLSTCTCEAQGLCKHLLEVRRNCCPAAAFENQ